MSSLALGRDEDTDAQASTGLESAFAEAIEAQADASLERYIAKSDFKVRVTAHLKKKSAPRIPFLSRNLDAATIRAMSRAKLSAFVESLEVELAVRPNMPDSTKKLAVQILTDDLHLVKKRGDKISVVAASFENAKTRSDLELTLTQLDNKLGRNEQELARVLRERNDSKRELTAAKTEMQRLMNDLVLKTTEADDARKGPATTATTPQKLTMTGLLQRYVPHFIIAGGLVLLFLIYLGLISRSGSKMGTGLTTIAKAFEGIGGALATERQAGGPAPLDVRETIKPATSGDVQVAGAQPKISLESLQARLAALQQEIAEQLNPRTEMIILRHLSSLLANSDRAARAVAVFELLGKERSNELFSRLNLDAQEAVVRFLRVGQYSQAKGELMLEAGDELITKLMAESITTSRCELSDLVSERLLKIKGDDLARAFRVIDVKLIPRLLLYLDAQAITYVFKILRAKDYPRFEKAVAMLSQIPLAEGNTQADPLLLGALDLELSRLREDTHRPYLLLYQEIVATSDEEVGADIVDKLVAANPRIESQLRGQVVSVSTLFALPRALVVEVIATFSNKDIAALSLTVKDSEQKILQDVVPERRKLMLADEIQALQAASSTQLNGAKRRARSLVLEKLRRLKADNLLPEFGVQPADPPPATAEAQEAGPPGRAA